VASVVVPTAERVNTQKLVGIFERDIEVDIDTPSTVGKFLAANWQWVAEKLLLPIGTAALGWYAGSKSARGKAGRRRR
jgi:hypothetical protein